MKNLLIRQATVADVARIHQLQRQWAAEQITYGLVPDTQEAITSALGPYTLVAELEGTIIGFLSGRMHQSAGLAVVPTGAMYVDIENLYVEPGWRSHQVGGRLLESVLAAAKQAGLHRVLAYSASQDSHRILTFYERHGFRSWGIQMFQEL